jgi:hypothetical protein
MSPIPVSSVDPGEGSNFVQRRRPSVRETVEKLVLSNYTLLSVVFKENGSHTATWLRAGGSQFREPFSSSTVERIMERAHRCLTLSTGIDALLRYGSQLKYPYPAGFIYHVGRCGSTLVANVLRAADENFVLSEPGLPLSVALEQTARCPDLLLRDLTRASLLALCARAPRRARHSIIKFFHGYTFMLPLIRDAVPDVREIFVYRDPVEVIMSMAATPSAPWLWSEYMTGLPASVAAERSPVELAARIVGRLLDPMQVNAGNNTMLLNYNQIGPQTPAVLSAFLGLAYDATRAEAMASALKVDAKHRDRSKAFIADSDRKQRNATSFVREAAAKYATSAYLKLEELRAKSRAASQTQPAAK